MNEIKVGDMVKHVFKKNKEGKPMLYKVLEVKVEPTFGDKFNNLISDDGFKDIRCLSENNNKGWLNREEVEKVK